MKNPAGHGGGGKPVRISDLRLVYRSKAGPVAAIDGLTLDLTAGSFTSVLGPSGCGKSTLVKVLAGLLKPTSGRVMLQGQPVDGPTPDVGIVFQQATLLPWKTVRDNILIPARLRRHDPAEAGRRADDLIGLVRLDGFAESYPHELSGGMQSRVALARALMIDPPVLAMDEPFAALDALTRERMMIEVQRLWLAATKTVLFVTHSIPEAVFLSDRVIVLSPRPARITLDLAIDLPRPRSTAAMTDPRFGALCETLRTELYAAEDDAHA